MDFSKLLNAIRGNKAAEASAAPKDRPETEPAIPVEVAPTVAAADHPPPTRPTGGVVQSLLGQFAGHREAIPPPPRPVASAPANGPANGYDDVLASAIPPASPPSVARPSPPGLSASSPLDGDWFDVALGNEPPLATTGSEASILELPPDTPPADLPSSALGDLLAGPPSVAPPADPFEVSGKVDLSWTPIEVAPPDAGLPSLEALSPGGAPTALEPEPGGATLPPPVMPPPIADSPAGFDPADFGAAPPAVPGSLPSAFDSSFDSPSPYAEPPHPPATAATPPSADEPGEFVAAEAAAPASHAAWLAENLDEALILLDAPGAIRYLNPMAEYLLGCPRGDALGCALLDLAQRLGGDNAALWEHLAVTSEAQQFSANVLLPDGQSFMASFAVIDIPPSGDWLGGRAIAIRDETRLRAEMSQIIEDLTPPPAPSSALNVTPEQLKAMHTSLQMVLGFAELLHRGEYGPMNPQQFEMFRNIEHHAKQLAGWIGLPQD
ncbi:MAG: hypothetical protein CFK52_06485 [Chloracidobacterium sp. CP2_5A]|nr:MAG: hypothetical protein CFK52_06485 [Chloracidobacterium sp. CP2_5A]